MQLTWGNAEVGHEGGGITGHPHASACIWNKNKGNSTSQLNLVLYYKRLAFEESRFFYRRVRLPRPIFSGLPRVAWGGPHRVAMRLTTLLSPHWVDLPRCECMIGVIGRVCHHWSVRVVIPLHWISRVRPPSFFLLRQNVSSMHSIFLQENFTNMF